MTCYILKYQRGSFHFQEEFSTQKDAAARIELLREEGRMDYFVLVNDIGNVICTDADFRKTPNGIPPAGRRLRFPLT